MCNVRNEIFCACNCQFSHWREINYCFRTNTVEPEKGEESMKDWYICSVHTLKVLIMLSCSHKDKTVGFRGKGRKMLLVLM